MRKLNILVFIIICFFNLNAFAGGPWIQKKGKSFYKLSEWWVVYDEHFTTQGNKLPNTKSGIYNTTLFAEYGITDKITGIINSTILSHTFIDDSLNIATGEIVFENDRVSSMGDTDLELKYALSKPSSKIPVAISLIAGLPTGKNSAGKRNNLQTGDGELNILIQLHAGKGFKIKENMNGYVATYFGYNERSKNYSDEMRFGLEAGMSLISNRLWLISRFNGVESLKNGSRDDTKGNAFIFANETEYIGFALEASYYLSKKLGIAAEFAGAFRAEYVAAAPSFSVGLFYDMSK